MKYFRHSKPHSSLLALACALLLLTLWPGAAAFGQNQPPRTPSETVNEFYKAMRERRFREAFALSIHKSAVEELSAAEFEEFRPDFENMAADMPQKIEVVGEQISGDTATVFVKIADESTTVTLLRDGGIWIIGSREDQEVVKKAGKKFFYEARINAHHDAVQDRLRRISVAQLAYASQHNNLYADLPALIAARLLPADIEANETIGYRFRLTLGKGAKSWSVGAEPLRYNQTGRLSFLADETGIRSADTGGKPLQDK